MSAGRAGNAEMTKNSSVQFAVAAAAQIAKSMRNAGSGLIDAFFPSTCLGCESWTRTEQGPVCSVCFQLIQDQRAISTCPQCARSINPLSIREDGCAACRAEPFWNVAEIVRVGTYDEPLRSLLIRLKYGGRQRDADFLGDLLAQRLLATTWIDAIDVFVPVPMHILRRLQRPVDHAVALADACVRRLRVMRPKFRRAILSRAVVRRSRYAPSQTNMLTRQARFENIRDSFAARRRTAQVLSGKQVCIIDNLLVTGATLHEVSKILRRHGAKRIYAAVVARAPSPGDARREPVEGPEIPAFRARSPLGAGDSAATQR